MLRKLHIGCGTRHIPEWVNTDVRLLPGVVVSHLAHALPFKSHSFDTVYSAHVLEHFPRAQTIPVLREWHRVLQPEGILRVAVPDFSAIARAYVAEEVVLDNVLGPLVGRQDYTYNFHYRIFDFPSLCAILHMAGFSAVTRYDWRRTEHADVDDYSQSYWPHMSKERGRLLSLNVEARRS